MRGDEFWRGIYLGEGFKWRSVLKDREGRYEEWYEETEEGEKEEEKQKGISE